MRAHTELSASVVLAMALIATACGTDRPTAPGPTVLTPTAASTARGNAPGGSGRETVSVCHFSDATAHIISVASPALMAHLEHDDYVAELVVDKQYVGVADGVHFGRIGDAIAAARATRLARGELESGACRITIAVGPGVFSGSTTPNADPASELFPLVLDVPDVTVHGSFAMGVDASGRATGAGVGPDATVLAPTSPLPVIGILSLPLFVVNGHPVGSRANGVTIEGFIMQSGHTGVGTDGGGQAVLALRVRDLVIRGNRFGPGFTESIDLRATSGTVEQNHLGGGAGTCDICLAGPGDYTAQGNRLLAGGIPGILAVPAVLLPVPSMVEQWVPTAMSTVTASILNNEVHDHLRLPVGTGLRFGAVGIGTPDVVGTLRATVRDNTLINNRFGMLVEAAFPVAGTALRGDIDVTTENNTIVQSCMAKLLVSFSRHTTALGLTNLPYLRNTTYSLSLGDDFPWAEAWYGHPAGFGNALIVNGATMPNGFNNAYDGAKTCSP